MDAIAFAFPVVCLAIFFGCKYQLNPAHVVDAIERKITSHVYSEYGFNVEEYDNLQQERVDAIGQIDVLQGELAQISKELSRERAKIDRYSIDISIIEE